MRSSGWSSMMEATMIPWQSLKLAEELGVAERCRWDIRRIPDEEVGDIFAACDVVLVTYSAKFRSASGVLNAAVSARKPVLASSGLGPLKLWLKNINLVYLSNLISTRKSYEAPRQFWKRLRLFPHVTSELLLRLC